MLANTTGLHDLKRFDYFDWEHIPITKYDALSAAATKSCFLYWAKYLKLGSFAWYEKPFKPSKRGFEITARQIDLFYE